MLHYQELKKDIRGNSSKEASVINLENQKPEVKSSGLAKLRLRGGQTLNGTIHVSGAKNASLPLMCACLLTEEPLQLANTPVSLGDIKMLSLVLRNLGVTLALREDGMAIMRAANISSTCAPYDLVRKMRASILVLGPLLTRFHHAEVSLPGGCAIGSRPVDFHIQGLKAMGADIQIENGYIKAKAEGGLKGAEYEFPAISVTGTENLMMAATLAKGTTTLKNAAIEPEIVDLGECLIKMGANIEGLGTQTMTIHGVESLHGAQHPVLPDRIEAGTWAIGAIMTDGEVTLKNAKEDDLKPLFAKLIETGAHIETAENGDITIRRAVKGAPIKAVDISTAPHPDFPTDLQAQFMAMMTIAEGTCEIQENIFENRFMHVPELARMGANIHVEGNISTVTGVKQLTGTEVMATDLRASVAMVLCGMIAEGETNVNRIYHLERGYERIVDKLSSCGVKIERIS